MSERLVLTWDQTLDDHVAAHQRLVRRRLRDRAPLLLVLVGLLAAVAGILSWIGAAILVAFSGLLVLSVLRRKNLRQGLERYKEGLATGPARWELDARGLAISLPARELRVPWTSIREVLEGRDVVLFFVSRRRALFVPERAMPDRSALLEAVARWREAPGEPVALTPPADDPWVFQWTNTLDDHVAYVRGVLSRARRNVRALVLGLLLGMVALLQGLVALMGEEPLGLFLAMAVGFGAVSLLLLAAGVGGPFWRLLAPWRVRLARWRDPESFPLEPIHLQVGERGIYYRTVRGSGQMGWAAVTAIHDNPTCVNLMIGPLIGFSLPDRLFDPPTDRARFFDEVDRRVATAPRRTGLPTERGEAGDTENPFAPPESS